MFMQSLQGLTTHQATRFTAPLRGFCGQVVQHAATKVPRPAMTATLPRYMKPREQFHNYQDDVNESDKVHSGEDKPQKDQEPNRTGKKEGADEKVAATYEQKVKSPLGGTGNELSTRAFKGYKKVASGAGDFVGDGGDSAAVHGVEMLKQKPDLAKLRAFFSRVVSALVDLAHYLAFWKSE